MTSTNRWLATFLCGGLFCAGLTSCKVGPDYRRPGLRVPTTFKSATTQESVSPKLRPDWWRLFNDSQLNDLEVAAIRANPNLQAAAARVLQARASSRIVQSQFYPVITADPSITRSRASGNRGSGSVASGSSGGGGISTGTTGTATGTGGTTTGGTTTGGTTGTTGGTSGTTTTTAIGGARKLEATSVQIPFDLTYEVDIWGRVRSLYDASQAQVQATSADFQVVLQTLEADVAQDYFNIRSLDAQDDILQQTVASYQKQIELIQKQLTAGLVSPIDLRQAETLLNSTLAQEIDIRRQRADMEHALAILLGLPPSDFAMALKPLDMTPPTIPVGLPSELLRRRPDVAEAEFNLVAANADVGVAIAEFYPKLRLSGAAGFESLDVKHAVDWTSRFWSIGPSLSIPIFEGGQLRANLDQVRARYDELVANYRNTVLGAYRDVEDSLTDLHLRAEAGAAQNRAVASAREYLRLSEVQYQRGLTNYLLVIDAERTLLQNELSATQLLNQRMVSTVLLMKALGGGWDPDAPPDLPVPTQPK